MSVRPIDGNALLEAMELPDLAAYLRERASDAGQEMEV